VELQFVEYVSIERPPGCHEDLSLFSLAQREECMLLHVGQAQSGSQRSSGRSAQVHG
jgi:hypothetical protein